MFSEFPLFGPHNSKTIFEKESKLHTKYIVVELSEYETIKQNQNCQPNRALITINLVKTQSHQRPPSPKVGPSLIQVQSKINV